MLARIFGCKMPFCVQAENQTQAIVYVADVLDSGQNKQLEFEHIEEASSSLPIKKLQKSRVAINKLGASKGQGLFTDKQFPPNNKSLGNFPTRKVVVWRRIAEFIKFPVFIQNNLEPEEALASNLNDSYLLSTLSALLNHPNKIQRLFVKPEVSQNGYYLVKVCDGGVMKEVIVDDYFPLYESTNQPVFSKPRLGKQIWQIVLQKVWAKLSGSYSNIQSGLPHSVLSTFSNAPCFCLDIVTEDEELLWLQIMDAHYNKFPIVISSKSNIPVNCGIRPLHTYCVTGAFELQSEGHLAAQIMKVVCAQNETFAGEFSMLNSRFWNQINAEARRALGFTKQPEANTFFYLSFAQLRKYFQTVDICHIYDNYSYNYQKLQMQRKACYYSLELESDGQVYISLHQKFKEGSQGQEYGRMSLILSKQVNGNYQYVISKMEVNFPTLTIRCPSLQKGRYIVYMKCYKKYSTSKCQRVLSVYSERKAYLKPLSKHLCESFIQRVFLDHALKYGQKQKVNKNQDWICTKMLYNQGGFAYIAAYVQGASNNKIRISFNKKQFDQSGWKIMKPYSNIQKGRVQAEAGKPCIIVCRLSEALAKDHATVEFPPDINIMQTI